MARIQDVKELTKLFKLSIPVPSELDYYITTLKRSPQYADLDSQLAAFEELETFAQGAGYKCARSYKLDSALPKLVEHIKASDAYRRLTRRRTRGLRVSAVFGQHWWGRINSTDGWVWSTDVLSQLL